VIGQDLVVQPDAVLRPVDFVQFLFGVDPRGFLISGVGPDLAQILALDPLKQHVVALFFPEEQVFVYFEYVIADHVLQDCACEFHDHLADRRPCHVLQEKVVDMAARKSMSNRSASYPGTKKSFSFSFGTWTFSVSPGLASDLSNVIRLTTRGAFIAHKVLLLYVGRSELGTSPIP